MLQIDKTTCVMDQNRRKRDARAWTVRLYVHQTPFSLFIEIPGNTRRHCWRGQQTKDMNNGLMKDDK